MSERGMTLTSVLVIGSVLIMIMTGVLTFISQGFKAVKGSEFKAEIVSLKETLRQSIDCDATWTANAINVATDCTAAAPKPLLLVRKDGTPLSGPLLPSTGGFLPLDGTFKGSGNVGEWRVRAYCDAANQTLVVRYARTTDGTNFLKLSSGGRAFNWETSPTNPLFGRPDAKLCVTKFIPVTANCVPNPSGSAQICTRYVECPVTYYPPPNNSWGCFVGCAADELPISCGFSASAANTFGGHYSIPTTSGGVRGCLCNIGGISSCSTGTPPCLSTCNVMCISMK